MRSGGLQKLVLILLLAFGVQACRAHTEADSAGGSGNTGQARAGAIGSGADVPDLVVNRLTLEGVDEQMGSGLTAHLCAKLGETTALRVICAQDVEHLIQARTDLIKVGACDDDDCIASAAEKLSARYDLRGSMHKVGSGVWFRVNIVDNREGKLLVSLSEQAASAHIDACLRAVSRLAKRILEAL